MSSPFNWDNPDVLDQLQQMKNGLINWEDVQEYIALLYRHTFSRAAIFKHASGLKKQTGFVPAEAVIYVFSASFCILCI